MRRDRGAGLRFNIHKICSNNATYTLYMCTLTIIPYYYIIQQSPAGIISVFDLRTGELLDKIHNKSPHSCDLQLPTGVTSDTDGQIFFTDANNFFCNHFVQVRQLYYLIQVRNKAGCFLS